MTRDVKEARPPKPENEISSVGPCPKVDNRTAHNVMATEKKIVAQWLTAVVIKNLETFIKRELHCQKGNSTLVCKIVQ